MHPDLARIARIYCGAHNSCPVVTVPGDAPPTLAGESFHYTTPAGKPVRYPRAYGYRTVYHPSTLRVEVGERWGEGWALDRTAGTVVALHVAARTGYGDCSVIPYRASGRVGYLVRHTSGRSHHTRSARSVSEAVQIARTAWLAQDRADYLARQWSGAGWALRAIPVTMYASRLAGNCDEGTRQFAARLGRRMAPAAVVLGARNDMYTRRAVATAAALLDSCPVI